MSGQAKDYAIGAHKDQAVFAIFRAMLKPRTGLWSKLRLLRGCRERTLFMELRDKF